MGMGLSLVPGLGAARRGHGGGVAGIPPALFAAHPGREGVYYGAASDPSITALLAENLKALDAGVPVTGWVADGTATATVNGNSVSGTTGSGSNQLASVSVTGLEVGADYAVVGRLSGTNQSCAIYLNDPGFTSLGFQRVGLYAGFFRPKASTIDIAAVGGGGSAALTLSDVKLHRVDWTKLVAFADPHGTVPLLSVHQTDRGFGLLLDRSKGLAREPVVLTNPSFDAGNTGWASSNATVDASVAGQVTLTGTSSGGYGFNILPVTLVPNAWYELEVDLQTLAVGSQQSFIGVWNGVTANNMTPFAQLVRGKRRMYFQAKAATCELRAGCTNTIGNQTTLFGFTLTKIAGNHYVQETATARGELTAQVNLNVSAGATRTVNPSTSYTYSPSFEGVSDVYVVTKTAVGTNAASITSGSVTSIPNAQYRVRFKTKGGCYWQWSVGVTVGCDASGVVYANKYGVPASENWPLAATATPLVGGWFLVEATFTALSAQASGFQIGERGDVAAINPPITFGEVDFRLAADAIQSIPAYQRVGTGPQEYDSVGFPVRWRGQTDDFGKARINPNGATKSLVMWAGQKASDAAIGTVVEHSPTALSTPGSLWMLAPATAGAADYGFRSGGTAFAGISPASSGAPARTVLRGVADIAADISTLYVNGAAAGTTSADQGTGSYTEQDVYFWSRAGTSLFFNGYASTLPMLLFMQPGDPGLSAAQLSQLDKAYAKAVGVTL